MPTQAQATLHNPPAFPLAVPGDCMMQPGFGMSLRDWFAGQALIGLLSHPKCHHAGGEFSIKNAAVAREAGSIADAMLAERVK